MAVTSYVYNTRDDLVGILDAEGKSTAYEYDGAGNLIKTTEPGEAVYRYVYDKLNRLAKKVNPLGAETLYTYNKDSSLTGKTDGNGVQTGNEYTFNAESYNPNIQSQYLRARYYDTVKGSFMTEDSYLGDIRNPLTLNRNSLLTGFSKDLQEVFMQLMIR